jgi:hypothetical protein
MVLVAATVPFRLLAVELALEQQVGQEGGAVVVLGR